MVCSTQELVLMPTAAITLYFSEYPAAREEMGLCTFKQGYEIIT